MKFDVKSEEGVAGGCVKAEDCVKGCHQQRRGEARATKGNWPLTTRQHIRKDLLCPAGKPTFTKLQIPDTYHTDTRKKIVNKIAH